ncbi:MAG: glycosyltransferase 87 family protein [Anaerolineae bacterium]
MKRRWRRPLAVGVLAGQLGYLLFASFGEDFWAQYLVARVLTGRLSVEGALEVWPYPHGYDNLAFEALLALPLSFLPPVPALLGWTALSAAFLALAVYLLRRMFRLQPIGSGEAILLSLAWPVTFVALFRGQISTLVVLSLAGALALAGRRRPFLGGLAASLVLAKPHLWLGLAAGLLARSRWRLAIGLGIGSGVLLLVSLPAAAAGLTVPDPERFFTTWFFSNPLSVSLVGRLHFLPWPVQAAASLLGLLAVALWWWRRREESASAAGFAWVGYLIFTPHLRVYDLVVLLPVILAALPWQSRWAQAGLILTSIGAIGSLRFQALDLVAIGLVCIAVALWSGMSPTRSPGENPGTAPGGRAESAR